MLADQEGGILWQGRDDGGNRVHFQLLRIGGTFPCHRAIGQLAVAADDRVPGPVLGLLPPNAK